MTGRLRMRNRDLKGIPTPLDTEVNHAANVDYVLRKKRSLEVIVGEEENNNGGGTGEESYEDKDGFRTFTMSKKNIPIEELGENSKTPWGEIGYQPTIGEVDKIFQLHPNSSNSNNERPNYVKILVPGTLSFYFTFRAEYGQKGEFNIYEDNALKLKEDINFFRDPTVVGMFTFNSVSSASPAQMYIINTSPDSGDKLKGTWDWEIIYKVKISDIPK